MILRATLALLFVLVGCDARRELLAPASAPAQSAPLVPLAEAEPCATGGASSPPSAATLPAPASAPAQIAWNEAVGVASAPSAGAAPTASASPALPGVKLVRVKDGARFELRAHIAKERGGLFSVRAQLFVSAAEGAACALPGDWLYFNG